MTTKADMSHFYIPLFFDLIFFLCAGFIGFLCLKKSRLLFYRFLFFFAWFFCGLGILMQLYPLDMTVSERWFYFPFVGFLGLIGLVVSCIRLTKPHAKVLIITVLSILFVLLCVRTIVRNTNWSNPLTLYSHDIQVNENEDIETDLAQQLMVDKQYGKALTYFEKLSVEDPANLSYSYSLGYINESLGSIRPALAYYHVVLSANPSSANYVFYAQHTYLRLGGVYLFRGDPKMAMIILKKAVSVYPGYGPLWAFLAIDEYELHMQKSALFASEKAKELFPSESTFNLYQRIRTRLPVNFNTL
jgi:Tfp pilus assembly protein PilF